MGNQPKLFTTDQMVDWNRRRTLKQTRLDKARKRVIKCAKKWRGSWDIIDFPGSSELPLARAVDSLLELEGKK